MNCKLQNKTINNQSIYLKLGITRNEFKNLLIVKYWLENKSSGKIGKEFNISGDSICYWFKKFNIPTKNLIPIYKKIMGTQQGNILVLNQTKIMYFPNSKQRYILCQCIHCNEEHWIYVQHILKGQQYLKCKCRGLSSNTKTWGESNFNTIYRIYKCSAKKRNLDFELTKEQFQILNQQNCYYCDTIPSQKVTRHGNYGDYIYNGIDRVDNNLGYVISNCVTCCGICNKMKLALSQDEFLEHINKICIKWKKI